MLKVELHSHTADDPIDRIPYSTVELIDRAVALGYDALAITLIEGKHVLLLNFSAGAEEVCSFSDLARLKAQRPGLVVAPHPYFPASVCLRGDLDRHADLFDAVEMNAMFTRTLDFNQRAERWARRHGKPLVGNCDVHRLVQLGSTYSLVDAPPDVDAICDAIAAGRVVVESQPLAWSDAVRIVTSMMVGSRFGGATENGFERKVGRIAVEDQAI